MFLTRLLDLYSMVVLGSVIISWLQLAPDNPVVRFVETMTEPVLNPIRKILPSAGGLDFSPMVLLIALQMAKKMVAGY